MIGMKATDFLLRTVTDLKRTLYVHGLVSLRAHATIGEDGRSRMEIIVGPIICHIQKTKVFSNIFKINIVIIKIF